MACGVREGLLEEGRRAQGEHRRQGVSMWEGREGQGPGSMRNAGVPPGCSPGEVTQGGLEKAREAKAVTLWPSARSLDLSPKRREAFREFSRGET